MATITISTNATMTLPLRIRSAPNQTQSYVTLPSAGSRKAARFSSIAPTPHYLHYASHT